MIFFRNLVGFVLILPWVVAKFPKSIEVKNFKIVLIRSLSGLLNLFFIFLAVQKISLVNTTLLNNTAPFFVPFILWFWLKKPIEHKLWPAVIVGFMGIALILDFDRRIFSIGAIYALLSGICLAITTISLRMTSKVIPLLTYIFYFYFIGLLATLPIIGFDWKIIGYTTLLALISIGLFSMIGQVCFYIAMKHSKAQYMAPFSYSAVIFSGLFDWLIWGTVPAPFSYLGIILIMAAGIWIIYFSKPPETPVT